MKYRPPVIYYGFIYGSVKRKMLQVPSRMYSLSPFFTLPSLFLYAFMHCFDVLTE